jgi:hypothetical protein
MAVDRPFDPLSEAEIQKAVFVHLSRRKAATAFAFHCPNGGLRHPREAMKLKAGGVRAGVPDVIIIKDGQIYGLELKTHGGRVSPVQIETMQDMQRCGATVAVTYGLDQSLEKLEQWGILTGGKA